jgi:hypothetical protein
VTNPSLIQKTQPKLSLELEVHIIPLHRIEFRIPQTFKHRLRLRNRFSIITQKLKKYNTESRVMKLNMFAEWKKIKGDGQAQEEDGQVDGYHLPVGE